MERRGWNEEEGGVITLLEERFTSTLVYYVVYYIYLVVTRTNITNGEGSGNRNIYPRIFLIGNFK